MTITGAELRQRREEQEAEYRQKTSISPLIDEINKRIADTFREEHGVEMDSPEGAAIIAREAAENDAKRKAEEDEINQRRVEARLARSGLPVRHVRAVWLNAAESGQALDAVKAWVPDASSSFLVLSGGVGVRKTGAAVWALAEAVTRGREVCFVRARDLAGLAAHGDSETKAETWRKIRRCALLCIDDLGAEHRDDKGWFLGTLEQVIDERYADDLRTVITCNLDAATFKANYGERIVDRLRESGRFVVIAGTSTRRKP